MLLGGATLSAQNLAAAIETITVQDIRRHMLVLASDSLEGRKTGEPGITKAADYLAGEFKRLGLVNPGTAGNPYIQEYRLYRSGWEQYYFIQGTDTIRSERDLLIQGAVPEVNGEYEFVFAGFGIDHPKYSNYKDLDVRGKVVIYITGEPKDKNGNYISTGNPVSGFGKFASNKDSIAFSRGAVSAVRIDPSDEIAGRMIRSAAIYGQTGMMSLSLQNPQGSQTRSYVYSTVDAGARIMGITREQLTTAIEELNAGKKTYPRWSGRIKMKAVKYPESVIAENVAGIIEGTDLKDQFVIVTAHYDHLGKSSAGIRYGADDNASGTIGILEVAEAFTKAAESGYRPRRSILFLPVSGEEMGLLGSQAYTKNPIVPLANTHAAINMDMIGRRDGTHTDEQKYVYLYLSGDENGWLHQAGQAAMDLLKTDLKPEYQFRSASRQSLSGSDHVSFESVKVPVAYFFNGLHPDYHKPADTWDKILYDQMQETVRLVFTLTWQIADSDNGAGQN
jgi:hypothetical protein